MGNPDVDVDEELIEQAAELCESDTSFFSRTTIAHEFAGGVTDFKERLPQGLDSYLEVRVSVAPGDAPLTLPTSP